MNGQSLKIDGGRRMAPAVVECGEEAAWGVATVLQGGAALRVPPRSKTWRRFGHFAERIFGQTGAARLNSDHSLFMSLSFARKAAVGFCVFLALPAAVLAQTNYYATNGIEYAIVGNLPGDQTKPDVALNAQGGFVVWQDNATDGNGLGISAARLDSTLSGTTWRQRVNIQGTNDQSNPRVAMLQNGGAVFVWQGGPAGHEHIYARFLAQTNSGGVTNYLWLNPNATNDLMVNTFTNNFQINPAVAALRNGNVVVVWESFDQASSNSLLDVYGQVLTSNGTKVGGEFLVNQFTSWNQRDPTVAALANGGFVVAWVSEQERRAFNLSAINNTNGTSPSQIGTASVDIYARIYNANGVAQSGEFRVNADDNPASNPAAAGASDGNYLITWNAMDMTNLWNSWDIYARPFNGTTGGPVVRVNSHTYGDQYLPRLSAVGGDYLIVWTSLGQDGSREGVYGQFVHEDGSLIGGEFRVNTTTLGSQMQPTVASDGAEQFLAVWSSFTFTPSGMDLFAQRYLNVNALLPPINTLYVWAPFTLSNGVYQPQLCVTWPTMPGISISNYEVYVDGAGTPAALTVSNLWVMTAANGLTKNSVHSFAVDYLTTDGRRAPLSPAVGGATWGGLNWGGIPYEWMEQYFGGDVSQWPSANARPAAGAPTLLQIFQSGGDPTNSATWLQQTLVQTSQGLFLNWNTQPGHVYQVQVTTNLTSWTNVGLPRMAAGTSDSVYVGGQSAGFYRVIFLY
jgi:hypothetical protein